MYVCVCMCRDVIPSCDPEEFLKEAAEVPHFLKEVEECRRFQTDESVSVTGERKVLHYNRQKHLQLDIPFP